MAQSDYSQTVTVVAGPNTTGRLRDGDCDGLYWVRGRIESYNEWLGGYKTAAEADSVAKAYLNTNQRASISFNDLCWVEWGKRYYQENKGASHGGRYTLIVEGSHCYVPSLVADDYTAPAFEDFYPYAVPDAAIGYLVSNDAGLIVLETGTKSDVDGPFGGRVAYIGKELPYPSNDVFTGSQEHGSDYVYAEFARPQTPLRDDDGVSSGTFFGGVEVVATQCRRHTGWIEQADDYSAGIAGDTEFLINSDEFPTKDELGGFGVANVTDITTSGGGTSNVFYQDYLAPMTPRGLARCGGFSRICIYNSDWPTGVAPGGRMANLADPHNPYIRVIPSTGLGGSPPVRINSNAFQWVETTWRYRAVYIRRGGKNGDEIINSAWSTPKTFTFCPHTCSCVHIKSRTDKAVGKSESRTVNRFYNDLVFESSPNAQFKRHIFYDGTDYMTTTVTGLQNDSDVTVSFDPIPGASGYKAIIIREGGVRFGPLKSGTCSADTWGMPQNGFALVGRPVQWNLTAIQPGGAVNFNGADTMSIQVNAVIKARANGSRNVGEQCAPSAINVSTYPFNTGGPGSRYAIAGALVSSVNAFSGCTSGGIAISSKDGSVIPGKYCNRYYLEQDAQGKPIYIYQEIPNPCDGANMVPHPDGWPGPWPIGEDGVPPFIGKDYGQGTRSNTALLSGPEFAGCSLATIAHPRYFKGHCHLWIVTDGKPDAAEQLYNERFEFSLADGRKAYYSIANGPVAGLGIEGFVILSGPDTPPGYAVIGYDAKDIQYAEQPPPVVTYAGPHWAKGPLTFYVNADEDLVADPTFNDTIGHANVINPAPAPGGTGLLGSVSVTTPNGVRVVSIYDRPQLRG